MYLDKELERLGVKPLQHPSDAVRRSQGFIDGYQDGLEGLPAMSTEGFVGLYSKEYAQGYTAGENSRLYGNAEVSEGGYW